MARSQRRRIQRSTLVAAFALVAAIAVAAPLSAAEGKGRYAVQALVSDQAGAAAHQDGSLVNAWGLAALQMSPWWVANNGTNSSTLYRADGSKVPLTVAVDGGPTGLVANNGAGFLLGSAPARFIFASEDGKIRAWNGGPAATVVATVPGAVYKGLAILDSRLYAANFAAGTVDVFGAAFGPTTAPGGFADRKLPDGYAPFGIQAVGTRIFVAYAKREPGTTEETVGKGLGIVDAFDGDGNLLARVARRDGLNAPWGIALAPKTFGRFGGDLLVGNFGDGRINAYEEERNGHFEHEGRLRGVDGKPLAIEGLWALEFGFGNANSGPVDTLFFTAGPGDEEHGLFGSITAVPGGDEHDDGDTEEGLD